MKLTAKEKQSIISEINAHTKEEILSFIKEIETKKREEVINEYCYYECFVKDFNETFSYRNLNDIEVSDLIKYCKFREKIILLKKMTLKE